MISSVTPSAKYSCSELPPMLVKGRTAIDGLSGTGGGFASLAGAGLLAAAGRPLEWMAKARMGSGIFRTICRPRSVTEMGNAFRTCSRADSEMHNPPGSARAWIRAAMFTPSPSKSPDCTMTSPAWTPMRNWTHLTGGSRVRPGQGSLNSAARIEPRR